jgi:hypothetical protein
VLRTAKKTRKNLLAKVEDKLEEWTEEYEDKQLSEFSRQFLSQNVEKQPEVLSLEVILPEEIPAIAQVAPQKIKKRHR